MRLSCCLLLWGVGAIGGCGGIASDGSLAGHDAGDGGHEHDSATDAGDSGDGPDSAVDLCAPVTGIGLCGLTGLIPAVVCWDPGLTRAGARRIGAPTST